MRTADDPLARECAALCRYAVGRDPDPYVTGKYIEAHRRLSPRLGGEPGSDPLSAWASRGRLAAGLVDAYTRVFRRDAIFRRKLILLAAILECAPSTAAIFEAPASSSPAARTLIRLLPPAALFVLRLALSVPIVGPRDLLSRRRGSA